MARINETDLTFESLQELDGGRIGALLKKHLAQVANDCMNRPGDDAKRKVTLEFLFEPVVDRDDRNRCEMVICEIECKSKVPTYRSEKLQMRPHMTGFIFNRDCPSNLNQPSLPYEDEGDDD